MRPQRGMVRMQRQSTYGTNGGFVRDGRQSHTGGIKQEMPGTHHTHDTWWLKANYWSRWAACARA